MFLLFQRNSMLLTTNNSMFQMRWTLIFFFHYNRMQRVSEAKEIQDLKLRKKPIILHFYTEWCGPCKISHQILEKQLQKAPGSVIIANINCDQSEELVLDFQVDVVPTIILLNNSLAPYHTTKGHKAQKITALLEKARELQSK